MTAGLGPVRMPDADLVRGQGAAAVGNLGSVQVCPNFAATLSVLHKSPPAAGQEEVAAPVFGVVTDVEAEAEVGSYVVFERKAGALGHTAGVRPL